MTVVRLDKGLRVQPLDQDLNYEDEDFLLLMLEHPPRTKLSHGDVCYLTHVPPSIRQHGWFEEHGVPRYWKVQFVISMYQFEMHSVMQQFNCPPEQATTIMSGNLMPRDYSTPMVYAVGFPHGDNPNTAAWFPERILRRLMLRTVDVDWEPTLDEFQAPFTGYNSHVVRGGFILDLAPDLYAQGNPLYGPLSHEEDTFQTAAQLGLEEGMMVKRSAREYEAAYSGDHDPDRDHDLFTADRFDGEIVRHGY